jgi:hypothetical protein
MLKWWPASMRRQAGRQAGTARVSPAVAPSSAAETAVTQRWLADDTAQQAGLS